MGDVPKALPNWYKQLLAESAEKSIKKNTLAAAGEGFNIKTNTT
jgi:hypothetical protein